MPLTPKQARFVAEYLVDLNATQAAIRSGYSEKTAKQQGARLLTNADVRAEVNRGTERKAEAVGLSQEMVLEGIQRLSSKAEEVDDFSVAMKGFELLGKHLKMFTDKVEHSGVTTTIIVGDPYEKKP